MSSGPSDAIMAAVYRHRPSCGRCGSRDLMWSMTYDPEDLATNCQVTCRACKLHTRDRVGDSDYMAGRVSLLGVVGGPKV